MAHGRGRPSACTRASRCLIPNCRKRFRGTAPGLGRARRSHEGRRKSGVANSNVDQGGRVHATRRPSHGNLRSHRRFPASPQRARTTAQDHRLRADRPGDRPGLHGASDDDARKRVGCFLLARKRVAQLPRLAQAHRRLGSPPERESARQVSSRREPAPSRARLGSQDAMNPLTTRPRCARTFPPREPSRRTR